MLDALLCTMYVGYMLVEVNGFLGIQIECTRGGLSANNSNLYRISGGQSSTRPTQPDRDALNIPLFPWKHAAVTDRM